MTWRFEPGEELREAFRRVAAEEMAKLRECLDDESADRGQAIHQARQSFKRLRALLRLARPALGDQYRRENLRWRKAGRLLSGRREADVLAETFQSLVAGSDAKFSQRTLATLRAQLNGDTHVFAAAALEKNLAKVRALLDSAERELPKLRWPSGIEDLRRGLRKSQSRLRKGWRAAAADPTPAALHAWRKRVKDHSAQLRLFRRALPGSLSANREQARKTAELLGTDHDLWCLAQRLSGMEVPPAAAKVRDVLRMTIEKRRAELRRQASAIGDGFSSEKPAVSARAIIDAWSKNRHEKSRWGGR